jgi:hypothetical protein
MKPYVRQLAFRTIQLWALASPASFGHGFHNQPQSSLTGCCEARLASDADPWRPDQAIRLPNPKDWPLFHRPKHLAIRDLLVVSIRDFAQTSRMRK